MYEENIQLIDSMIRLHKSSLKLYIYYAIGLIVIGITIAALGKIQYMGTTNQALGTILSAGGSVIASFSGFSFKEYLNKTETINLYKNIKESIQIFKNNPEKQQQFSTVIQNNIFKI